MGDLMRSKTVVKAESWLSLLTSLVQWAVGIEMRMSYSRSLRGVVRDDLLPSSPTGSSSGEVGRRLFGEWMISN